MAKEDAKSHQLYKQIEGSALLLTDPSAGTGVATNGWDVINLDANFAAVTNRTYIDLAGWSAQDLTTFTQGVDIQKQQFPLKTGTGSQTVLEFDFLTTRRLTDAELINVASFPGFASSTVDLMEVIYGLRVQYAENGTIAGTYIQIGGETFGSGNPTAMDKLHWTRLYILSAPSNGDQFGIYPTNLVLQAVTSKEKDLVWMERLRRSYVLQGGAE